MKIKNPIFILLFIFLTFSFGNTLFAQEADNENQVNRVQTNISKKIDNPLQEKMNITKAKLDNVAKLIEQEPDNIDNLLIAAKLELILTNTKSAINYYRKAVAAMKKNPDISIDEILKVQQQIVILFMRMNKKNIAIAEFKKMCDIDPDNLDLKKEFADFLVDNYYPKRAFLLYKQILENDPSDQESIEKVMLLNAQGHVTTDEMNSVIAQEK